MNMGKRQKELRQLVGTRIRSLRKAKGWTQEELGGRANLDFTTVGSAERGDSSLSLASLDLVATALGVELADLVRPATSRRGTEAEGLIEELLTMVRGLPLDNLRGVNELVRVHLVQLGRLQ
jgi:transcriptional regulator with XRE-family HTH domain